MNTKVTIIVPTLNSEKYILECIDSICKQHMRELEILVIDANSNDNTAAIVRDMIKKDSRIRLIQTDRRSYGYQVNMGIKLAKGEYVGIVESDDFIDADSLEDLYVSALSHNADIMKADFRIFVSDREGKKYFKNMLMFKENNIELYDKALLCEEYPWLIKADRYLWKGLYRRSFLIENNIWLNETAGAAFQDQGFLAQTLIIAKRIVYASSFYYNYRKDNDGSSVYSSRGIEYIANEFSYICEMMNTKLKSVKELYMPYIYQNMMQMVTTRYKMFALKEEYYEPEEKYIIIIRELLTKAIAEGVFYREAFLEEECERALLFVSEYETYKKVIEYKVKTARLKMDQMIKKIIGYDKVILYGCGDYGSILKMILANKNSIPMIIECDNDENKVLASGGKIKTVKEVMKQNMDNALFLICAGKYKHEIRKSLNKDFNVSLDDIYFYESGASMYTLKL